LALNVRSTLRLDTAHDARVPRFNIYLLRLLYILMFVFLGRDAWSHLLTHQGSWNPDEAVAWCVWAAFSLLALPGILHPLRLLPLVLLEITYKVLWLAVVAYPWWSNGQLAESPRTEHLTFVFLLVILPIVAVPWKYAFAHYVRGGSQPAPARAEAQA